MNKLLGSEVFPNSSLLVIASEVILLDRCQFVFPSQAVLGHSRQSCSAIVQGHAYAKTDSVAEGGVEGESSQSLVDSTALSDDESTNWYC